MPVPKGYIRTSLRDRFEAKIDRTPNASGCWLWTGFVDKAGYPRIKQGGRESPVLYAHRLAHEIYIGPIPDGFTVDHVLSRGCAHTHCVNPEHLEAVTAAENAMRARSHTVALHLAGTCRRGHDASESYRRASNGQVVYCRACRREDRAARREGLADPGS